MRQSEVFPNEKRVRKIGGRLLDDYLTFRDTILCVNDDYLPLFFLLGFRPEDKDFIIDCLLSRDTLYLAKEEFIARKTAKVESGKIKIETLLSKYTLNKKHPTQEAREKALKKQLRRVLIEKFKEIEDSWDTEYNPSQYGYRKRPIQICRESLSLSKEGFIIDVDKFIEIYSDYFKACESKRGKLHKEAADAINRFFSGAVEITNKELEKYFILSNGIVKPNPKSITTESYMRLGYIK